MSELRPSHDDFNKLALEKEGVEELYQELEEEYLLIEELIRSRLEANKTQSEVD